MCQVLSVLQPSSAHSSSADSGYCHRSREHSDRCSAYHGTRHTPDRPTRMASLRPGE